MKSWVRIFARYLLLKSGVKRPYFPCWNMQVLIQLPTRPHLNTSLSRLRPLQQAHLSKLHLHRQLRLRLMMRRLIRLLLLAIPAGPKTPKETVYRALCTIARPIPSAASRKLHTMAIILPIRNTVTSLSGGGRRTARPARADAALALWRWLASSRCKMTTARRLWAPKSRAGRASNLAAPAAARQVRA